MRAKRALSSLDEEDEMSIKVDGEENFVVLKMMETDMDMDSMFLEEDRVVFI